MDKRPRDYILRLKNGDFRIELLKNSLKKKKKKVKNGD